jgi:hypothetical protein
MHQLLRHAAIGTIAAVIALAIPVATQAQAEFSNGNRVEGRIGTSWEKCTVIGARRVTGGYVLRCDRHPDQDTVFAASDVRVMQGPDRPRHDGAVNAPQAPAKAAVSLNAPVTAFKSIPPRIGVYGCMNQDAFEVPTLQFGLIDGSTYSTFDGGRGHYKYATQSGILTFTSGPFRGLRRSRYTERTFRILDEHGAETSFVCPWTPKNPRKPHW